MAVRDYNSAYYDPYGDYQYEIDKLNQLQQQDPELAPQYAQLSGNMAGMYAANKIPGVLSSTLPTSIGTPVAGAGSIATPTASAAPGLFSGIAPMAGSTLGLGALAGIGGGIALGAKGAKDLFQGNKSKGIEGWGGRATLGIATGGLSEVARALGVFGHKSTKQRQAERTNNLLGMSADQSWQDAVNHFRSVEHPEGDTGQNFNAAASLEKAKKDGKELWGSSAVMSQFGPRWLNELTEGQREETTRKLALDNLISNKGGDWQVNDSDKANSILDQILKAQKK